MLDPASRAEAATPPLRISVTRPRPDSARLDVHGEVDAITAPPLEVRVRELIDGADDLLVIDLSGVTFLASSGLAVLIRGARRASERGVRLRLVPGSRAVRRPLEVTGSDQLFDVYEDVGAALGE